MIPAKSFYFMRHGKTEANAKGLTCGGDWDISLNEEGVAQAQKVSFSSYFLNAGIKEIFVSPMQRARQTAEIVNSKINCPVVIVENLREWRVGEWETKPWGEVPNPFNTTEEPPGGESRAVFEARVEAAVAGILKASQERPLVVAHGAVGHALFTVLGADTPMIENCTLYFVEPKDRHWHVSKVFF